MSTRISGEVFLTLLKQSGLVDFDQLKRLWKEFKDQGLNINDSKVLSDELVARNVITRWQVEKLMQGKHKGFFLGKYRLLSLLGTGGMSSVYLAEHVLMRRRVAIKVLPSQRVDDTSYLQRFHREAQAVAALDHRNIVRAYDVDKEGKTHFLVMEYVAGQSMQELVVRKGPLDFVVAAEYIRQAAEGLAHAHRAGMVHRDIKPGNLLVDEKGTVRLLDLGLARFFDDKDEHSLTIQHDEKVLGTADYLAPEQAIDSHSVDIRADIYSLGCTLYFILTGHPPFPEGTLAQRLMAHQTKQPRSIAADRPDIDAGLLAIVDQMMAKKPDDRFQTARDTSQALTHWLMEHGGATWSHMNPVVGGASSLIAGNSAALGEIIPAAASGQSTTAGNVAAKTLARSDAPALPVAVPIARPVAPPAAVPPVQPRPAATATPGGDGAGDSNLADFFSNMGGPEIAAPPAPPVAAPAKPAEPRLPPATVVPPVPPPTVKVAHAPAGPRPVVVASPPTAAAPPATETEEHNPFAAFDVGDFAVDAEPAPPPAASPESKAVAKAAAAEPEIELAWPGAGPNDAAPAFAPSAHGETPVAATDSSPGFQGPIGAFSEIVADEEEPAPKSAAKRGSTTAARKTPHKGGAKRPAVQLTKQQKLLGGGGVAVLLLAIVGYSMSGSGKKKASKKTTKPHVAATDDAEDVEKPRVKERSARSDSKLRRELVVGPTGPFKTIAEALADTKKHPNDHRRAMQVIKVAGGATFTERIVIDASYPPGIRIETAEGQEATLAPPGGEPIVEVTGKYERFQIAGFKLDAAGKDIAVKLVNWVSGARLERLTISGYGNSGIVAEGVQSYSSDDDKIRLDRITFRPGNPQSAGVVIRKGENDPAHIKVDRCRFIGLMAAGVKFESQALDIDMTGNIFALATNGVRLEGDNRVWTEIVFNNNSFFQNERGILFTHMPGAGSNGFGFYNNLFAQMKGPAVAVEKDFNEIEFFSMYSTKRSGAANNWIDGPAAPQPGEIKLFDAGGGRRDVKEIQFVSTDPANPDFLAPAPNGAQRSGGTQIGAQPVK